MEADMEEVFNMQHRNDGKEKIDQDIYNYIKKESPENYSVILNTDARWEVFQHLNPMRKSLLNWYEFNGEEDVLEIGGGFGALTSLLCERCKHVTTIEKKIIRAEAIKIRCRSYKNLDVEVLDVWEYQTERKYDVVVVVGVLETIGNGSKEKECYIKFLQYIKTFLKPAGKLLIAVDNRYGLQNFCGTPDKYTGIPFAGINGYQDGSEGYTFDRAELKELLKLSGIDNMRFYYPFPDYRNPQLVYSEKYLYGSSLRERLVPYYANRDSLLANQMDLYVDVMKNHALEFLSNSFFVEASLEELSSGIVFACMSTDRGKKCGFITSIHEQDYVTKKAIHKEGQHNLESVYKNALQMGEHGVPVVKHSMVDGVLKMPLVFGITVSEYLLNNFEKEIDAVVPMFELLYDYICRSSDYAAPEENILLKKENKELEWGPILKTAYIDMVPANAFYIDGKMFFFDQEFTVSNMPAKYVLYRALKYTYVYVKKAESILPITQMKERFQLTELWEYFEKYERRFIRENRNLEEYANFYQWTKIDRNQMKKNAEQLLVKNEAVKQEKSAEKKPVLVDEQTAQVQKKLLELLKKFIEICEKYNLRYFMFYGSLLGTVRHGGFIPWDDDLDVAMPREDYERFREIMVDFPEKEYEFQCPENESRCFYGGYGKFRDSQTSGIDKNNWGRDCNLGMCIDVFPLDGISEDNEIRENVLKKIRERQMILFSKLYANNASGVLSIGNQEVAALYKESQNYSFEDLVSELSRNIKGLPWTESNYIGVLARYYAEEKLYRFFPKGMFEESVLKDFEGLKVSVPRDYEQCLITLYGRKYMEIPMVEKQKKHRVLYDVYRSYKYYARKSWESNVQKNNVVLYGTGVLAERFIKEYGKPAYMVDPDKGLWGRLKYGVLIKEPEVLTRVAEESNVVICMSDVKKAERRLDKMGKKDYFIYYPFEDK